MTDLARLVVKLTAQTAEYEKKLDQANAKLSRFQKSTDSQLKQIGGSFASFNRALGAIGVGISFVAITRALAGAAQKAIEYGDAINKASIKTGVGAQAFSELAYAAKQNDVELSALETGFKKLQVAISEAGSGSKSAQATFAALGIEFESFRALAPEKQFEVIAEQISRIKDPADKARAATELFGRAGADLLPMFEKGAEGIRKAREEAQRLGASLSQEQVEKLAAADDAIKRLVSSWDTFARTLTVSVAPALTKVFDLLSNADAGAADLSRRSQIDALLKSRGNQADLYQDTPGLRRELAQIDYRERQRLLGPGRQARRSMPALATPPGYTQPPSGGGGSRPDPAALAGLREIEVTARQISVGAMEQLYRDMDAATQTSIERQLSQWQDYQTQLDELLASGRITSGQFNARSQEITDQFLEPITITAEKIFPPAEQKQLGEFWLQASRNTQDILADFIFNPFEERLSGLAQSFAQMLQRMAAEAVAADIAGRLFGTGGVGSGGGWLGQLGSFAMTALGGMGGGGELTPITVNAQRIPGYADGGYIKPGQLAMVGERGPELAFGGRSGMTITPTDSSGMTVVNHFSINAPDGRVSRATELQIAAAAARGAQRANARNN